MTNTTAATDALRGIKPPVEISSGLEWLWWTLGGLAAAIGLVIDNAIVVVENIVLHRDGGESRTHAVRKALNEITTPLIGSTITPVVVFLPLVVVSGVTGSFFRALAITMTAALLTSLVLALTWTPGLSLLLLGERRNGEEPEGYHASRLLSFAIRIHRRLLDWSLAKPLWLGGICLLLVVGTWAGYQALGSNLLPEMDEGGFILDYTMPAGSSLSETNRVLAHVENILQQHHLILLLFYCLYAKPCFHHIL